MDKSKRNHSDLTAEFARRRENIDKTLELGNNILSNAHSEAIGPLKQSLGALSAGWNELHDWMEQLLSKIRGMEDEEQTNKEKLEQLLRWLLTIQADLKKRDSFPLPSNDIKRLKEMKIEHQQFQEEILARQKEFDELIRIYRKSSRGSR